MTDKAFTQNQGVSVLDDQGGSVMKVQSGDTMPTLRAQTHGHPPIVMQTGHTKGNGCGFNEDDVSFTLEAVSGGGQAVMDIFRLDPESSNSMKSDNPHSGCHRENVCHTLDTTPPNPAKGQGGMAIVEKVDVVNFQGNKGGCAVAQDEMFTLNAMHGSDVHVVGFNEDEERTVLGWRHRDRNARPVVGSTDPLTATDYKDPPICGYEDENYVWDHSMVSGNPKNGKSDTLTATMDRHPFLVGIEEGDSNG